MHPESTSSMQNDHNALLLETGLALASELSLPLVLQRIVDAAATVTGARYGALGVLGKDGLLVDFITTGISAHQRAQIGHLPVGRGILGVLINDARPLRLADLTTDPRSVGFPRNHPPMRSFLGAPVVAHGLVYGNLYLTEKQGAPEFDAEDERALTVLATQAGVAIANARLYEEAQGRAQRLEALREVIAATLGGASLDTTLELVARRARELAEADLTTIAVADPGADPGAGAAGSAHLTLTVADGLHAEELRGLRVPVEGSVSGEAMRTGKTIVLANAAADERAFKQPARHTDEFGPAMFVPLRAHGQVFGTLTVARRAHPGPDAGGQAHFAQDQPGAGAGVPFTDADIELVELFADQAAVAFDYARARQELARLALLEDRERIARELHDGAIQALFAVGMRLQGTAMLTGDPAVATRIEAGVAELDHVIGDLRNYIFGLRPGILADRQLAQALRDLAADFEQRTGVTCVADFDERVAARLAPRAADVVQLVREALSNIDRHADAATCRISLHRQYSGSDGDGWAVLAIEDDGRGYNPATATRGQGLGNMDTRVANLGGELTLSSVPGEGTTVRATIPL